MRKILVLMVGLLLVSDSVLFGETPTQVREPSVGRKTREGSGPVTLPAGERAFFSLTDHWIPPGARELKFEVRLAGRSLLQDVLQLPEDAADGIFELLAGDPASLERIFTLVRKAGERAQILVSLDGQELRSFSLPEFLAYNKRFRKTPPDVRQPLKELRTFAPAVAEAASSPELPQPPMAADYDPECVAGCEAERDECYQTDANCIDVVVCDSCEYQYNYCYNGCYSAPGGGGCTDPKSVSQRTSSWIKNTYWGGTACLSDVFQHNKMYDFYTLVIQNDRIQRTEYCNGSVVETVLSSWDTYGSCTRETPWTCSFSTGFAYGPYCPY